VVTTIIAMVLAIGGAGLAVVASRGSDDPSADGAVDEAAVLGPDAAPGDVFDHASRALDDAGTFSYTGTVHIEAPEIRQGMGPIVIDREVVGEVVLPDGLRETFEDAEGVYSERISVGSGVAVQVWRRDTAFDGHLEARPWAEDGPVPGELDPYRLPEWLDDVVDPRDGGEDTNGRPVVHGDIPVAAVGEGPDLDVIAATVELTMTRDGDPRRVQLEVSTRELTIEAAYDLAALGGALTVEPPPAEQTDATPWFNEEDVAAFEGPPPWGLTGIPEGWEISGAYVVPDAGGCASVAVDYQDIEQPTSAFLWLETLPADCAAAPAGEPIEAAGFAGAVVESEDGAYLGVLVSDDTAVQFATDLAPADLEVVLETLAPLDLAATPEPLAGIPSSEV
jgi:hypothetical protein